MQTPKQSGFTLYELMLTVLVMGVILAMGVPNFADFTKNSRMASTANDLHSSFLLARSEAARAKSNVTICAGTVAGGCAGTFNQGWIIFVDTDGDIALDPGEAVLRSHPPVPNQLAITPDNGATYFSFAATGLGRGDVAGPSFVTAMICDDRGTNIAAGGSSAARRLVVTPIGRATVIRDKTIIDNAGGCP
jgi:type IV fimbrial biogenesis protein FimT